MINVFITEAYNIQKSRCRVDSWEGELPKAWAEPVVVSVASSQPYSTHERYFQSYSAAVWTFFALREVSEDY